MKRISIGSWAYTIGPYENDPVDFETVCTKLLELGFDGVELGGLPTPPPPSSAAGDGNGRGGYLHSIHFYRLSFL